MDSQGESSSSNNINQKVTKIDPEVKEEEPENKKVKQDESENAQETQNETNQTSIIDLPTEMLMKILKQLDDKNLIACRLVNRMLRDTSTEILSARSEIELQFAFDEEKKDFRQWIKKKKMGERTLAHFLECFKESKKCLCTRFLFRFNLLPLPSKFKNEDLLNFFSFIKDSVKCLKLLIEPKGDESSIQRLSEDLSDLLQKKIPRLEEFGLAFPSEEMDPSKVQLFPSKKASKSTTTTKNTVKTETGTIETRITTRTKTITKLPLVRLPHLKVLHLNRIVISKCPRIVDDLFKAAVNLKSIKNFQDDPILFKKHLKAQGYVFLHKRGKLDLLEDAQITPSVQLISALKEKTNAFKLRKLDLSMSSIYEQEENWTDASNFISALFESSKETLRILRMDPVGFLPSVPLPTFTKLEVLSIKYTTESEIFEPVFPSGINSLDVFPVLRTLDLNVDWIKNFPREENIPRIPTLETLRIHDYNLNGNCIQNMSLMCPNLKDFTIRNVYDYCNNVNFPEVGRAIWTHMKQLKSLDLQIDLKFDFNTCHSLDSCFTGISVENCKRLYELTKAEEYLKRWEAEGNIPKTKLKLPERESPSILDLKGLRNLSIKIHWHIGDDISADNLLQRGLTCVSETYAFKLMKNLNFKIDQDVDY